MKESGMIQRLREELFEKSRMMKDMFHRMDVNGDSECSNRTFSRTN